MKNPRLNKWYYDEDRDERFEVIDMKEDYIVVQGLDGTVSEYSVEEWDERQFSLAAAPDEWEISWDIDESLGEMDERFASQKRTTRNHYKDEDSLEADDLSFSDDLEESQDFESH